MRQRIGYAGTLDGSTRPLDTNPMVVDDFAGGRPQVFGRDPSFPSSIPSIYRPIREVTIPSILTPGLPSMKPNGQITVGRHPHG